MRNEVVGKIRSSAATSKMSAATEAYEFRLSKYARELPPEAKKRYISKLQLDQNMECLPDPYCLDEWEDDPSKWPDLTFGDLYCYLIESPGIYTTQSLKAYKSLEAYRYVVSGHVQEVLYHHVKDDVPYCALKVKVLPSQRVKEKPHVSWVYVNKDTGAVLCAHCTCMAGLGEVCSHVGGLLFKIEMGVRLGLTSLSSTSKACEWNHAFRKQLNPMTVKDMQNHIKGSRKRPISSIIPSGKDALPDIQTLKSLKEVCPSAVFFTTIPPLDPEETDTATEGEEQLVLQPLRKFYKTDLCPDKADFTEQLQKIWESYKCCQQQAKDLERRTRSQADSELWLEHRKGRITGTKAHAVLTLMEKTNPENLIRRITGNKCYYLATKKAVKWGKGNEDKAREKYIEIESGNHTNLTVELTGLLVDYQNPFLAVSADGIVNCVCCGTRCLEIKCPYKYKDCNLNVALNDTSFCIDTQMHLKKQHAYYTQVQLQMFIHCVDFCDFFVFTNVDYALIRVTKDVEFCQRLLCKCKSFFMKFVLPELVTRHLENGKSVSQTNTYNQVTSNDTPNKDTWCLCAEPEYGKMIACDNPLCPIQWFHYECVNIRRCPRGKWLCPECDG